MHSEEGKKARIKIYVTSKKFRKHFSKITKKNNLDYFQKITKPESNLVNVEFNLAGLMF